MRRALGHRPTIGILLAVAAAMCWPVGAAFAQTEPDELQAYLTGNGLLNRGLYELAIPEYRSFLEAHGDHEKARVARYGLSVCLYRLGRLDEALVELDTIQDEQSFRFAPEVALLRGHSLLAQGDYETAGTAFEALIASYPDHPNADDAAATLVESRYRQEGFDRAVEAAAVLAERWPKSPYRERAELFAGLSEMSQEQYAPAADRFEANVSRTCAAASASPARCSDTARSYNISGISSLLGYCRTALRSASAAWSYCPSRSLDFPDQYAASSARSSGATARKDSSASSARSKSPWSNQTRPRCRLAAAIDADSG